MSATVAKHKLVSIGKCLCNAGRADSPTGPAQVLHYHCLTEDLTHALGDHAPCHVAGTAGRKRNNQSPQESIEQGKATCTGLSIILVDACRAVGIPARSMEKEPPERKA